MTLSLVVRDAARRPHPNIRERTCLRAVEQFAVELPTGSHVRLAAWPALFSGGLIPAIGSLAMLRRAEWTSIAIAVVALVLLYALLRWLRQARLRH